LGYVGYGAFMKRLMFGWNGGPKPQALHSFFRIGYISLLNQIYLFVVVLIDAAI